MDKAPTLNPGDHIKLGKDSNPNKWWEVRAVSDRYAVCVRQADFKPKGTLLYTVIDSEKEIRGPVNLVGYGDGTYSTEQCEEMLTELVTGALEVSHTSNVPYEIREYIPA